ncbi:unnamed protein product [Heligmosomoides polygyrus]|uniref:PGM_PMM_I domain-containing protein n=1 Tax=Heligmosomoides polygyrus TaxID=6339 RepID=A0A183G5B9_HELPZ|nr:unnamed protein product [Heligmosomoides polygyrus]
MSVIRRLYSAGIAGMTKKGASSDIYIGAQTKLRSGLSGHGLNGIKVAVLHNDARAVLSAKILADNGAEVSHYGIKVVDTSGASTYQGTLEKYSANMTK